MRRKACRIPMHTDSMGSIKGLDHAILRKDAGARPCDGRHGASVVRGALGAHALAEKNSRSTTKTQAAVTLNISILPVCVTVPTISFFPYAFSP